MRKMVHQPGACLTMPVARAINTYLACVVVVVVGRRISVESRYIVSSGVHNYGRGARQLGFSVHALSKTLGPDEICSRIDAFLPQFREMLRSMSKEVGGGEGCVGDIRAGSQRMPSKFVL